MPLDRTAKRMIIGIIVIIGFIIAGVVLQHFGLWFPDKEAECRDRGEKFFKEIGSWPKLGDGRSAIDVAKERCHRTTAAF